MPIKKSAEYAQMNYIEPVILYDISIVSGHTELEIRDKAKNHSKKLIETINHMVK
ncbi:hypothetical protein PEC302110_14930 [Pectobacterium araliae]|uniref:Uncharacterized protein n=1 Tax=Pectobacterium araliae TaxID=3073862 RepID=A0AAN0K9W1_9GAMM|nr:hypothetical protein PEC302110_14930 [Pectobacterium sp. MAFF 302110]